MIIFMCDGSSKGNPGVSKIGVVMWLRTKNKTSKVTPDKHISEGIGIATNNDAEWQALIRAMELAQDYKDHQIFIYSDSMLATKQAAGKWKVYGERMGNYKRKFDELCNGFIQGVEISWLPRQLTVLADKMA